MPYDLSEYVWNGNVILRLKQNIKTVLTGQSTINLWVRNDKSKTKLFIFSKFLCWVINEDFYYSRNETVF